MVSSSFDSSKVRLRGGFNAAINNP
ncbi:hypothetical protein CY0110_18842 [Crocosphaera chwakensis CCY0110]|uniref:Uncharacterized protein n=1 Tax=Crocosphaera chwakensis CCY0110 TaxID=391612 RepID=A3IJA0_9CHRO|nr:hypothetical protein CY0110_18842 [Crocosphaera chwakensis CCY0110]